MAQLGLPVIFTAKACGHIPNPNPYPGLILDNAGLANVMVRVRVSAK